MTITSLPRTHTPDARLAARFASETEPLQAVLLRGARRLTRCDADAEDLTQDTLLHAYAGFASFQEGSNLRAWLFRILHNRWISGYRAKQSRPVEVSGVDCPERDGVTGLPGGIRSAEAEALEALADEEISAAMAALPDGFGEALFYADVEGYTYAETAAILDIPIGTVMSRVSRARKRLRIALAHLDQGRREQAIVEPQIA